MFYVISIIVMHLWNKLLKCYCSIFYDNILGDMSHNMVKNVCTACIRSWGAFVTHSSALIPTLQQSNIRSCNIQLCVQFGLAVWCYWIWFYYTVTMYTYSSNHYFYSVLSKMLNTLYTLHTRSLKWTANTLVRIN